MKPVIDRVHTPEVDTQLSFTQAAVSVKQSGQYQGEQARLLTNTSSLIDSAAEELTFGLAEKKGDSRTRRSKKKELKEALGIQSQLIREVERKQHLEDSTDKMKKRNMYTVRQLRAFLESYDSDRYQQYKLLQHAGESLADDPANKQLLALIDQAKTELQESDGDIIRAGINIQDVADNFARDHQDVDERQLHGFYRSAVLDYGGLTQTWQKIIDQHSRAGVEQGVGFLLKALAADYRALGSSIDKNHLAMIMQDMHQLRLLNTLHEHCSEVLQRRDLPGYSSEQFMQDVLAIQDSQWLEDAVIRTFAARAGTEGSEQAIGFLRDLKGVFNLLPSENFEGGDEQRTQILESIQGCQDYHIMLEEGRV